MIFMYLYGYTLNLLCFHYSSEHRYACFMDFYKFITGFAEKYNSPFSSSPNIVSHIKYCISVTFSLRLLFDLLCISLLAIFQISFLFFNIFFIVVNFIQTCTILYIIIMFISHYSLTTFPLLLEHSSQYFHDVFSFFSQIFMIRKQDCFT